MASLPAPWVCLWRHLRRRWNTKRLGGHKPSRHVVRHVALIIPSSPRAACSTPLRATLFFCAAAHDSFPHRMAVVVRGPSAFLTHMIRGCRGVPSIPAGSPQTPPRFLRRPGGEGGDGHVTMGGYAGVTCNAVSARGNALPSSSSSPSEGASSAPLMSPLREERRETIASWRL